MKIFVLSFSPTGTTRRVAQAVGEELAAALGAPAPESIPFTRPAERVEHRFAPQDIVVAAFPLYAGRLPNKLLPECKAKLFGSGTPVVPVCTFGNRSCDEALREQVLLLEENGFRPVGAAAFAVQHAFSDRVGTGRPDGEDWAQLREFARAAAQKLAEGAPPLAVEHSPIGPYYTPLKADGTPAKFLKAKPVVNRQLCDGCGRCAPLCPMGSIDERTLETTGVCIKCQACIRGCPRGARTLTDPDFVSHVAMLEQHYTRRAPNVLWL